MITGVIGAINLKLRKLFEKYPDAKIYGLTQSVIRITGSEEELLPCVVDESGESVYVGIDDLDPFILYHKNNSVNTRLIAGTAFGDEDFDIVNTFNNSLIVYMDRKKTKMMPDEVAFALQANFPNSATFKNRDFKLIRIPFQGVILNSIQVYLAEYGQAAKALDPSKSMLAINYQIEVTFARKCFSDCLF